MRDYTQALSMMAAARRVLLTTHARPDGDAMGSMRGIREFILATAQEAGRTCDVETLVLSEPGDVYGFLLPEGYWLLGRELTQEQIDGGRLDGFDLIIVADTSATRQLPGVGDYLQSQAKNLLIIDHHLASDIEGACKIVDPEAAAVGEMVFDLLRQSGWGLSEPAANALFAAIATDTGWFRYQNCTANTLRISADLIDAGARPDDLHNRLFENDPPQRLQLVALTLQTLELHCRERLAVMHITNAMLEKSGAHRAHIENIVNMPSQIGSVEAIVLLVEQADGSTRCSLRSKGSLDVNRIANQFNGGGHAQAAGATLKDPPKTARTKIVEVFTAQMA